MEIQELKTWQWILIGLIAGALFSCVYAWNGPAFDTQPRDTIEQGEFENSAMAMTKFGGEVSRSPRLLALYHKNMPMLRDVTVHPPIASDPKHYWVTGRCYFIGLQPADPAKPTGPEKVFEEWKLFKYPALIPYEPGYTRREEKKLDKNAASLRNLQLAELKKSLGGASQFPTVVEYLKAVGKLQNADFTYHFAWWEKPAAVWTLPPLAGLLIFGVAFPMILSAMNSYGLVKPAPVAKPKPSPVKKPVRPVPKAMPATVVVQAPPTAAQIAADAKKYGGEFYPVVKTGKD